MLNSNNFSLLSISPLDGRYIYQTQELQTYFSEYALNKTRVEVELKYLLFLNEKLKFKKLSIKENAYIKKIYEKFTLSDCKKIKKLEEKTKHDVKAVEYFIGSKFRKYNISNLDQWIHFGLTSNDINDNAYRILISKSLYEVIIPEINLLLKELTILSNKYRELPILGRTHGQPAVPTTFGKELAVFTSRLNKELVLLNEMRFNGKIGGAVGNLNSLYFAFDNIDWEKSLSEFIKSLNLNYIKYTTQITPAEDLITAFQNLTRINNIILGFNQDMWRYISDNWIVQKGKEGDVGSSTMPQKVNPIEFENSEGNILMANGLFEIFIRKLAVNRLQRDLSDSTVMRNIGVSFAHCLLAYKSCLKGIKSITPNTLETEKALNSDWSILTEALQTILRKEEIEKGYEKVAEKIRGRKINQEEWIKLVKSFPLPKRSLKKLINLTPSKYLGYANKS